MYNEQSYTRCYNCDAVYIGNVKCEYRKQVKWESAEIVERITDGFSESCDSKLQKFVLLSLQFSPLQSVYNQWQ